jgi:hypothetical protein
MLSAAPIPWLIDLYQGAFSLSMSIPASLFQSRSSARWVPERSPRDMKAACLSLIARNAFATSFALDAAHKFDQLAAPVEQKVSAPWLRKRNDKINVVDLERREERPATPAEIETGVYAEEF